MVVLAVGSASSVEKGKTVLWEEEDKESLFSQRDKCQVKMKKTRQWAQLIMFAINMLMFANQGKTQRASEGVGMSLVFVSGHKLKHWTNWNDDLMVAEIKKSEDHRHLCAKLAKSPTRKPECMYQVFGVRGSAVMKTDPLGTNDVKSQCNLLNFGQDVSLQAKKCRHAGGVAKKKEKKEIR